MANKKIDIELKQIAASNTQLFGLDAEGRVWVYNPREDTKATSKYERYAFWSRLTAHGTMYVPDKKKEEES